MRDPVIIEAAINGIAKKEHKPNVPLTADEIVVDSLACLDAGAAIIHAHNRSIRLVGQEAVDEYAAAWRQILAARPDALWYPTGVAADSTEDRLLHHELLAEQGLLRMAYVDPGSANTGWLGDDDLPRGGVYVNSYDHIREAFAQCERLALAPAVAIYEPGWLSTTLAYHQAGKLPKGTIIKLYFGDEWGLLGRTKGVSFGLPPTKHALLAYLDMLEGIDLPWSVSVWGGDLMQSPVARLAVEQGGHLHVGLEEFFDPDRQPTNVELVTEAVELCEQMGVEVASCAATAKLLGL
jgi:3-keto-5-aminohexanoate cleavage enzyme